MFDSLADRIREDDHQEVKTTERYIRWAVMAILTILLFVGMYYGFKMME
jgi:hypothetical protein